MRIIVCGALANKPFNGGEAWVRLSWTLGLRRLGHEVLFVEQITPQTCAGEQGEPVPFEVSVNRRYYREVTARFGLGGASSLLYDGGTQSEGLSYADVLDFARSAGLLINISGHLTLEPVLARVGRRAYIDIDPGFTQFWHADPEIDFRLGGHDRYFTIGENIGTPGCPIPTGGIDWRPTRQPVLLDCWPVSPAGDPSRFTTVASWRGPYGRIRHGDTTYGLKAHEFRKLVELPRMTGQTFEIALSIDPADHRDLDLLLSHGWRVVDPGQAAGDPDRFRSYVQGSSAEFTAAQGIYVATACGWFSDRTARYLASGRPALVQDTGFSRSIPTGEGLLAFLTVEEAAEGAAYIRRDYDRHCRAARRIAETHFDSDRVLGRLVREAGEDA